jgi:hypothetical protein
MKVLFCHISWMKFYDGGEDDRSSGGGSHTDAGNLGGEKNNFRPHKNQMFGYIETRKNSQIHIENLGAGKTDECIENILVVWTALNPKIGGVYIIGWYKNASVYRNGQDLKIKAINEKDRYYHATTDANSSKLLTPDERVFRIPRATKSNSGMGQSHVWYAKNNLKLVQNVLDYIRKGKTPKNEEIDKNGKSAINPIY